MLGQIRNDWGPSSKDKPSFRGPIRRRRNFNGLTAAATETETAGNRAVVVEGQLQDGSCGLIIRRCFRMGRRRHRHRHRGATPRIGRGRNLPQRKCPFPRTCAFHRIGDVFCAMTPLPIAAQACRASALMIGQDSCPTRSGWPPSMAYWPHQPATSRPSPAERTRYPQRRSGKPRWRIGEQHFGN